MVRHYSNLSFTVRTLSLVQGLILVGSWTLNYSSCHFTLLFLLPFFGLLLTGLIYKFHKGYYDAAGEFIEKAAKIETELFSETARPFSDFKAYHDKRYKSWYSRFVVLNATFTLIATLFVCMLIFTTLKYYGYIH